MADFGAPRYDDRSEAAFHSMVNKMRTRFILAGLVTGFALIAGAYGLSTTPDFSLPRTWGILSATVFLGVISGLSFSVAAVAPSHFYSIRAGALEYPKWGGLAGRGRVVLSSEDSFRREGRDDVSASLVLSRGGRRLILVPEDLLADPGKFIETLRVLGVREEPSRFRRSVRVA